MINNQELLEGRQPVCQPNETGVSSNTPPPLNSPKKRPSSILSNNNNEGVTDSNSIKKVSKQRSPIKKPSTSVNQQKRQSEQPKRQSEDVVFNLSTKQIDALNSQEKFILYGGAKGGGKSWLMCVWMFIKAMNHKGNKLFFCRRRSVDFTNTTLETWKKVIPAKYYKINEQKKKIYLPHADSVIDYGGLDDPLLIQALNSAEYAHIGGDQAEEFDRDSFAMLRGTLRHKLKDGSFPHYQILLTANPAQCWLKDEFILNPQSNFKYIQALPSDNPYLPADYVQNLAEAFKHRPTLLASYLHGSWDDLAGSDICIQPSWVSRAQGKKVDGQVIKRVIVNDPARFGDDENVIYVMAQTDTTTFIEAQQILEHKSLMDTAGRLSALRRKYDANLIAVDSIGIGSGIVDSLIEIGEPVLSINSSSKPTNLSNEKKYANLKSQIWMEAGEKFSNNEIALPQDYTLGGQLSSTKFEFKSNGRMATESKDEVKKRLGNSPDRADTLVMGLYALDKAERLDRVDSVDSIDRAGQGELMEVENTIGSTDYSGYSFAN